MSKNEDLKPLTVLFNHSILDLTQGDMVFLRPESYTAPYLGAVYQINGQRFVLVPKEAIIAMIKNGSDRSYSPVPQPSLEKR